MAAFDLPSRPQPASPWEKLLEQPSARAHFVQIYETGSDSLASNVATYLYEGLRRGDASLVVATDEHQRLFRSHLEARGADVAAAIEKGQLVCFDAHQTLREFLVSGQPDWHRFHATMRMIMRRLHPAPNGGMRAYGEMVGILWKARQFAAAVRLEQFWNRLLEQASFSLFCGYSIDAFDREYLPNCMESILCTHTHLVPPQTSGRLETALQRALDEVLGPAESREVQATVRTSRPAGAAIMPTNEAILLWLGNNRPECVNEVVAKAQEHYTRLSAD